MAQKKEAIWMGPEDYDPRIHPKAGWWIEGEGMFYEGIYTQMTIKAILNKDSEEQKAWDRHAEEARKMFAKIPKWRWEYTVEDWERDCAEEDRQRERKRQRFTPPPSPSPQPVASNSNTTEPHSQHAQGQQSYESLHQTQQQPRQQPSIQERTDTQNNADASLNNVTAQSTPSASDLGNETSVGGQNDANKPPVSPAASTPSFSPSQGSKKRKRGSANSPPLLREPIMTRSRAGLSATFSELDELFGSQISAKRVEGKPAGQKRKRSAQESVSRTAPPPKKEKISSAQQRQNSRDKDTEPSYSTSSRRKGGVEAAEKGPDPNEFISACWKAGIRF